MCQNYKSETRCTYGRKCFFRHVEAEEKPNRRSKKDGAKGSVALLKESASGNSGVAVVRDEKDDRPLAPKAKAQTDRKTPSNTSSGNRGKSLSGTSRPNSVPKYLLEKVYEPVM